MTAGTSNTLMVGEDVSAQNWHSAMYFSNGDYASCHQPINKFVNPPTRSAWPQIMSFRSMHTGGANFALADGSVVFVRQSIDFAGYRALCTRNQGEVAQLP